MSSSTVYIFSHALIYSSLFIVYFLNFATTNSFVCLHMTYYTKSDSIPTIYAHRHDMNLPHSITQWKLHLIGALTVVAMSNP